MYDKTILFLHRLCINKLCIMTVTCFFEYCIYVCFIFACVLFRILSAVLRVFLVCFNLAYATKL